jgi:F-type H+-transporting ATPase subunit a
MDLSPDSYVLTTIELGGGLVFPLNLTIVTTWGVMALLVGLSIYVTRTLTKPTGTQSIAKRNRGLPTDGQIAAEVIQEMIEAQISEVSHRAPGRFLPFVGTLFLFIATSNLLLVVPGFVPPTSSLSTTAALAIAVMLAVPAFAVSERGVGGYLAAYIKPTPIMLPFNIISELSRTLALAIRLYGNVMSGTMIAATLIGVAPLFLPVVMDGLGLLTGMIQAYIFAILAMVYIAAAVGPPSSSDPEPGADSQSSDETKDRKPTEEEKR